MMKGDVVRADRRFRRQMLYAFIPLVVLGALTLHALSSYLDEIRVLSEADPSSAIHNLDAVLNLVAGFNAVVSVLFAVYFFNTGIKLLKEIKYPPEETKVLVDARIRAGRDLRRRAAAYLLIASVALSTNVVMFIVYIGLKELVHR